MKYTVAWTDSPKWIGTYYATGCNHLKWKVNSQSTTMILHDMTFKKAVIFILTAVETWNLMYPPFVLKTNLKQYSKNNAPCSLIEIYRLSWMHTVSTIRVIRWSMSWWWRQYLWSVSQLIPDYMAQHTRRHLQTWHENPKSQSRVHRWSLYFTYAVPAHHWTSIYFIYLCI
jgi:hypothetical protein